MRKVLPSGNRMARVLPVFVLVVAAAVGIAFARAANNAPVDPSPALGHASRSLDDLLARFLSAIEERDSKALQEMRVDEREYIDVIMPGSIEPGKERRKFAEDKAAYFWDVLNTKSLYSEIALLSAYGGRKFTVHDVSWAKGVQRFDGYTGYAQLRLTVQDEQGGSLEIATGSVAEVAGRYKFVSYIRD